MASPEPMDLMFRLRFDAAILEHVARKATNKKAKAQARQKAAAMLEEANAIEKAREPQAPDHPLKDGDTVAV